MNYCSNCGEELRVDDRQCPRCGTPTKKPASNVVDNGGFGWGLLGFCIPIVGLILYLIWRDERPNTAKAAGTGALIGFIIGVISAIGQASIIGSLM